MNLYNGWINLNKPFGMSSNQAVQKIRHLLGKKNKVGHAGTLDPLAEGVLPVAVGEATKVVSYLMDSDKEYEFTITWGEFRSTGDAEGEVISNNGRIPTYDEITQILPKFTGLILQVPPIYSAIKFNGQPAYKLARKGEYVEIKPREINIYNLSIIKHSDDEGWSVLKVKCGKGTYIRSLAVDIAKELSTYGYVSFLKRIRVGRFVINETVSFEKDLTQHLLPINFGLTKIPIVHVTQEQAEKIKNGIGIFIPEQVEIESQVCQIFYENILQAIVLINKGVCKIVRGFNLDK